MTATPEALAATHAAAFGADRAWPAADFARYLADPLCLLTGTAEAFVLTRAVAGEAEILTLSTHPDVQGQGRATRVLADAIAAEVARGTTVLFLDVAADNVAARALYDRAGFRIVAERKNYYAGRRTALIMRRDL